MNEVVCHGSDCIAMGRELAVGFWLWDVQRMTIGLLIAVAVIAIVGLLYGIFCLIDFIQFKLACRKWRKEHEQD